MKNEKNKVLGKYAGALLLFGTVIVSLLGYAVTNTLLELIGISGENVMYASQSVAGFLGIITFVLISIWEIVEL